MIKELFNFDELMKSVIIDIAVKDILSKYKKLPKIKTNHSVVFVDLWNKFPNLTSTELEALVSDLSSGIVFSFFTNKDDKSIIIRNNYCVKCGERIQILITPTSIKIKELFRYETKSQCLKTTKVKTKIKCKTGNLLISDFFRTPDGDIQTHVGEDQSYLNLNSAKGLLEEHKRYLKKNIIKVQVGNTCPSIYIKGNSLYFSGKYKDKSLKYVGSIITDLWAITIIEKEHLEAILESRGYSQKEIKNIIKSTTQQTVKVAPGTYECHSDVLNQTLKDTHNEILYFTLKKIRPPQNKKK